MILAPVIARRKGEQAELLDELRAQGFTRVRVDGKVHELDAAPRLSKNVKHSVDVVIDRLRARADTSSAWPNPSRPRCGTPTGAPWWWKQIRIRSIFSRPSSRARYAITRCPSSSRACSRSTTRWAPCPRCDGLGAIEFFDPKRVVAHPNLSLASGAIAAGPQEPLLLLDAAVARRHYGFGRRAAWELLDEKVQQLVLSGSGQEKIAFTF